MGLWDDLHSNDSKLVDYICYLLLDFTVVDEKLEQFPLLQAMRVSEAMGMAKRFDEIVYKEVKTPKKQLAKSREQAETQLAQAAQALASGADEKDDA